MQLENKGSRLPLEDPQEELHAPIVQLPVDGIRVCQCASWETASVKITADLLADFLLSDLLIKKARLDDLGHTTRVGSAEQVAADVR